MNTLGYPSTLPPLKRTSSFNSSEWRDADDGGQTLEAHARRPFKMFTDLPKSITKNSWRLTPVQA